MSMLINNHYCEGCQSDREHTLIDGVLWMCSYCRYMVAVDHQAAKALPSLEVGMIIRVSNPSGQDQQWTITDMASRNFDPQYRHIVLKNITPGSSLKGVEHGCTEQYIIARLASSHWRIVTIEERIAENRQRRIDTEKLLSDVVADLRALAIEEDMLYNERIERESAARKCDACTGHGGRSLAPNGAWVPDECPVCGSKPTPTV